MRTLIKPNETVDNFYGTKVVNSSTNPVPIEIAEQASKLRQMLIDLKLPLEITVSVCDINLT